jgi:hypothetical protein
MDNRIGRSWGISVSRTTERAVTRCECYARWSRFLVTRAVTAVFSHSGVTWEFRSARTVGQDRPVQWTVTGHRDV